MGRGEQCAGPGPTKPDALCLSGEDSGAGGGPGPSFTGGERRVQRQQQAPAPRPTSLLEGLLLPGQHRLIQTRYKKSFAFVKRLIVCFALVLCHVFQVLEEAVSARFRSVSYLHTRGPGLAGHLSALQHGIMADLATVRHLLEHCVPAQYRLTGAYLRASHQCLHAHLAQVRNTPMMLQTSLTIYWDPYYFLLNSWHYLLS